MNSQKRNTSIQIFGALCESPSFLNNLTDFPRGVSLRGRVTLHARRKHAKSLGPLPLPLPDPPADFRIRLTEDLPSRARGTRTCTHLRGLAAPARLRLLSRRGPSGSDVTVAAIRTQIGFPTRKLFLIVRKEKKWPFCTRVGPNLRDGGSFQTGSEGETLDKILQRVKITLNSACSGTEFQCLALVLVYLMPSRRLLGF